MIPPSNVTVQNSAAPCVSLHITAFNAQRFLEPAAKSILHIPKPLYCYRAHSRPYSNKQRFDQIQASEQAVRRALARRGLADTHELSVNISAQFCLRKKVKSDKRGAVRKNAGRVLNGDSRRAMYQQRKLNVVAGNLHRSKELANT